MEPYTCDTRYEGPPPPKGYRIRCVRAPKKGECFMDSVGGTGICQCNFASIAPILERIEPVRLTMWANVYEGTDGGHFGYLYGSETGASNIAQRNAIAVAEPVTIEYYPQQ